MSKPSALSRSLAQGGSAGRPSQHPRTGQAGGASRHTHNTSSEREGAKKRLEHLFRQGILGKKEKDDLENVIHSTTLLTLSNALHDINNDEANDVFLERLKYLRTTGDYATTEDTLKSKVEVHRLVGVLSHKGHLGAAEAQRVEDALFETPQKKLLSQLQDLIYQKHTDAAICDWLLSVLPRLLSTPSLRSEEHDRDLGSDDESTMAADSIAGHPSHHHPQRRTQHHQQQQQQQQQTAGHVVPPTIVEEEAPESTTRVSAYMSGGGDTSDLDPSRYKSVRELLLSFSSPIDNTILRNAFFFSYRRFLTPEELLECLIAYYAQPPPVISGGPAETLAQKMLASRIRTGATLLAWIKDFFSDDFSHEMYHRLSSFLMEVEETPIVRRIRQDLDRKYAEVNSAISCPYSPYVSTRPMSPSPMPPPLQGSASVGDAAAPHGQAAPTQVNVHVLSAGHRKQPSVNRSRSLSSLPSVRLLDCDPRLLAIAFTKIQHKLFKRIRKIEIIDQMWKRHPHISVNALRIIEEFNRQSYWLATELLRPKTVEGRAATLKHFVQIAHECLILQNFHTALAFAAAMTLHPVFRLKSLKYVLDSRHEAMLEELRSVASTSDNYSHYRERVRQCLESKDPCLPHMAIIFKDLFLLQEISPLERRRKVIDLSRITLISDIISSVTTFQARDFRLEEPPEALVMYIRRKSASRYSEEDLLRRSLALEPKMTWEEHRQTVAVNILENSGF